MSSELIPQQAATMLALQAAMNSKVDPNWVQAAYPYLRAVVVEGAEAIEHHGWKWWKKQHCDLPQLQMELIDIWHFLLSEILLRHQGDEQAALQSLLAQSSQSGSAFPFDGQTYTATQLNALEKLELLIGLSAARRLEITLFASLMRDCGLDWTSLYRQYVAKNVLNFFRQDHGYKEGEYRKVWQNREDNEHLVELMESLPADAADYPDQLYRALKSRYQLG